MDLGGALWNVFSSAGGIAAGWLAAQKKYSSTQVELAGDSADLKSFDRLQAQLDKAEIARQAAEKRADDFAAQRNDLILQIGELKGQLAALNGKVETLTGEVARLQAIQGTTQ